MKKITTIIVCLLLVCLIATPAFAAGETVLSVAVGTSQVYRGDQIEVIISISGSNSYTGMGVALSYDTSKFEYVSGSFKKAENTGATMFSFDEAKKKMVLAFENPSAYSGELLRVTLKVLPDAGFGETEISLQASVTGANSIVKGAKVTIACKHNYETWTKVDNSKHTATCTICNVPAESEHTWDNGKVTKSTGCETPGEKTYTCTGCGATKVEAIKVTGHTWDNGTITKAPGCETTGEKTYKCKNCDATKVETLEAKGHAWDNDCDAECNNGCGTKRNVTHKYAEKYSNDAKGHWYPCTVCGDKKDYYDHTPDREAATEDEAQLCKYCGYVIADKLPHVHDVSPQIQKDAEGHWYYCNKGGCYMRIDLEEHVYDDDCDIDCNVCAYIRIPPHKYMPEWRGSQEGHWRVCALCNAESEVLPHTPGEPATQENPQLCVDCHFWIQWPLSHEHTYDEAWGHDEEGHWQICTDCQAHSETQEHTWDEGTVILEPTETQEGTKQFLCTVCQGSKTESIPMVTPTDPTEPSQPTVPGDPVEDDGFPWWILGASAGVLLVIGIVLLVIELIRSKKTNMHGKFSK